MLGHYHCHVFVSTFSLRTGQRLTCDGGGSGGHLRQGRFWVLPELAVRPPNRRAKPNLAGRRLVMSLFLQKCEARIPQKYSVGGRRRF